MRKSGSETGRAEIIDTAPAPRLIANLNDEARRLRQSGNGGEEPPPVQFAVTRMPMAVRIAICVLKVDMAQLRSGGADIHIDRRRARGFVGMKRVAGVQRDLDRVLSGIEFTRAAGSISSTFSKTSVTPYSAARATTGFIRFVAQAICQSLCSGKTAWFGLSQLVTGEWTTIWSALSSAQTSRHFRRRP